MTPRSLVAAALFAGAASASLDACGPVPSPDTAPDIFRVAVNGLPGGALLSVYGDAAAGRAYLAGGYVGVDASRLGAEPAGRMLVYTGRGAFHTACTTGSVLWWTAPVDGAPMAAGEGGRIVRLREGGACDVVPTGLSFAEGDPTYWGFVQWRGATWFVGGSARPDGPKGVLVRWDGRTFSRLDVPAAARALNLYKIDVHAGSELVVVGEGGMSFTVTDAATTVLPTNLGTTDSRLFTVSCGASDCWAVGGVNNGIVLRGYAPGGDAGLVWNPALVPSAGGWNGVWVADPNNVFIVGGAGQTMHTNGSVSFLPRSLTPATLHGVGGWAPGGSGASAVVLAVGGELGTADPSQRAVILVRNDDSAAFTVDGRSFMPAGQLRRTLGGFGQ